MSEVKRYTLESFFGGDCIAHEMQDDQGYAVAAGDDYVLAADYDAAISAKDARIAELDEVLSDIVKLLAVDKRGAYTLPPVRKILDWSARAELAIAAQPSPAPLAATHSEDVIDSLQRAAMMMDSHDALLALADRIDEAAESPMQISIRAADMIRFMVNEGLQDAKPARQVGGGEPWPRLEKPATVGNTTFRKGVSSRLVVERAYAQHEYNQQPEIEAERVEKLRAALAPAAKEDE